MGVYIVEEEAIFIIFLYNCFFLRTYQSDKKKFHTKMFPNFSPFCSPNGLEPLNSRLLGIWGSETLACMKQNCLMTYCAKSNRPSNFFQTFPESP